jgi:ABC-type multidrug transport system ATPase subunit
MSKPFERGGLAVHCVGLRHTFGDTVAVDVVDLDVTAGTVFGLP